MPPGDDRAHTPDFEASYQELRRLAGSYIDRFDATPTLQATALVHEVYLKLSRERRGYADQQHFFCTAAVAMRQILVNHARDRRRLKRGGQWSRITFEGVDLAAPEGVDLLVLNDALDRLHEWDARQAQIVELRFFVGLSVEEVADVMTISPKTVKRDWAMARAWLKNELASGGEPST